MLNIALFCSGRIVCYDTDLIPNLESMSNEYNVHLFMSINGERDEYHQLAEVKLAPWLKKIRYEKYKVPDDFIENTHKETLFQIVDNKKVPYTNLSCFYNDLKNYELIRDYIAETGINMDVCVKFRADIVFPNKNWEIFKIAKNNPNILYSNIPPCQIYTWGEHSIPRNVSDAFICCSFENLKIYCNTYNFILETNKELNGFYLINYEKCVTENVFGKPINYELQNRTERIEHYMNLFNNSQIKIEFFTLPYILNNSRRKFEVVEETAEWRKTYCL